MRSLQWLQLRISVLILLQRLMNLTLVAHVPRIVNFVFWNFFLKKRRGSDPPPLKILGVSVALLPIAKLGILEGIGLDLSEVVPVVNQ